MDFAIDYRLLYPDEFNFFKQAYSKIVEVRKIESDETR